VSDPGQRSFTPLAIAGVVAVAIVAGGGIYLYERTRALPGDAVRATAREASRIASAFRTGTITTSFTSYATEVQDGLRLQFATLKQVEVFERKDEAALFWGQLALPDVIVEARAPVEFTYYLDLKTPWSFTLQDGTLLVAAPPIRWNAPAVDVSAIRYEVKKGSLLRDEAWVLEKLRLGVTQLSARRAMENVPLVRETGRRRAEEFVETWLRSRFAGDDAVRARVSFADEAPASRPLG
jgi:hypothetical protein